jgi:hypothetical protein
MRFRTAIAATTAVTATNAAGQKSGTQSLNFTIVK